MVWLKLLKAKFIISLGGAKSEVCASVPFANCALCVAAFHGPPSLEVLCVPLGF